MEGRERLSGGIASIETLRMNAVTPVAARSHPTHPSPAHCRCAPCPPVGVCPLCGAGPRPEWRETQWKDVTLTITAHPVRFCRRHRVLPVCVGVCGHRLAITQRGVGGVLGEGEGRGWGLLPGAATSTSLPGGTSMRNGNVSCEPTHCLWHSHPCASAIPMTPVARLVSLLLFPYLRGVCVWGGGGELFWGPKKTTMCNHKLGHVSCPPEKTRTRFVPTRLTA